jgi:hypothetical protein
LVHRGQTTALVDPLNHTPSKHPKTGPRPWPARLFALGAVLLLVASGLVVVLSGIMGGQSEDKAQQQSAYAADALSRINDLGSLEGADQRARELGVPDVGADQVAALAKELADAQATLDAILAKADNLPALPEGYLPGMDVGIDVPLQKAGAYPVPKLDMVLKAGQYVPVDFLGEESPLQPHEGVHLPPTGVAAVDDALSQLMGACVALRDLVGQPVPLGSTLPDPCSIRGLEGLPVTDPTGLVPTGLPTDPTGLLGGLVPGGLPADPTGLLGGALPGSSTGQVKDANDAVYPDEQGALVAHGHASQVLGTMGSAYGQANRTLTDLLASYKGLAKQLQDLLDEARERTDKTVDDIPAILTGRLEAITAQAEALKADAQRLTTAYARTAQASAEQALGVVQDAVKARLAGLQTGLDSEVSSLNARAGKVMSIAASRSAAVTALVDSSVQNLTRMAEESGLDATGQIAAIKAAGKAALQSLEADAKAQVESLKAQAVSLQARAQSAVPRITAMGLRSMTSINSTLEEALAQAESTKQYLTAFATAQAEMAMDVERRAEAAALALAEEVHAKYAAKVKTTAKALVATVPDFVGKTGDLVDKASTLAQTEVGKDLEYILKVAKDYSKVPTDERKARAMFWSLVHDTGENTLGKLTDKGDLLTDLAQEVMAEANLARAQVLAIADA